MSEKDDLNPQLGELETEIMNAIWELKEATVQAVVDALRPRRKLAYTTVMTVMSRLAEKGFLKRRKDGRSFVYTPGPTRDAVAGKMLDQVVDRLYQGAAGKAIAHLLQTDEDVDEEELDRLEALIRAKRKERGR